MDLKMFIADKLIDAIEINVYKLNSPGYINSLNMQLEEDNEEILDLTEEEPQFCVDSVPSRLNNKTGLFKN